MRELDAAIAQKLFDYRWYRLLPTKFRSPDDANTRVLLPPPHNRKPDEFPFVEFAVGGEEDNRDWDMDVKPYSSSIEHAMQVFNAMADRGCMGIIKSPFQTGFDWAVSFNGEENALCFVGTFAELPQAICEAALKVL